MTWSAKLTSFCARLIGEWTIDGQIALKSVVRSRPHSVVAVVVIALAMTATAHMTAELNAAFWRTLPVRDPESLRMLLWSSPRPGFLNTPAFDGPHLDSSPTFASFPYPVYKAIRDEVAAFSELACWMDPGETLPVVMGDLGLGSVSFVSGNFFSTLGARPGLGRLLIPDDDLDTAPQAVAVLSERFWRGAFAGDVGVLERSFMLNGTSFRIVGVTEPGFFGLDPANTPDVMVPIGMLHIASAGGPGVLQTQANWSVCRIVGRVRRGVADEQARASAEAAMLRSMTTTPNWPPRGRVFDLPALSLIGIERGLDGLRNAAAQPMVIMSAVVGALWLIAIANVAGLLLARGVAREHEVATRLALGAGRHRLLRQFLAEALMLSVIGGLTGIALSYAVARWMPSLLSQLAPAFNATVRQLGVSVSPDLRVVGLTLAITLVTAMLCGSLPALRAARVDVMQTSRGVVTGARRPRTTWAGQALVAAQAALATVLLVGAALFVRTVVNLQSVDLGYHIDRLLYVRIEPRGGGLRAGSDGLSAADASRRRAEMFEQVVTHLAATPGVAAASAAVTPPLAEYDGAGAADEPGVACTQYLDAASGADATFVTQLIAPRFFHTLQLPLLRGRDFEWSERSLGRQRVVIVNQAFATRFFPTGVDPVGQTVGIGRDCPANPSFATIVGVVADSRIRPRAAQVPMLYQMYGSPARPLTVILRTHGDPVQAIPAVRAAMKDYDARVPLFGAVTVHELLRHQLRHERLVRALLLTFAGLALLLTCSGVYAVMAYRVSRRTPEIGVRMALGAERRGIAILVLIESLTPVAIGVVAGVMASYVLSQWLHSMLFGLTHPDGITVSLAALVLLSVAAAGCLRPAWQACRIDPVSALRAL